MTMEKLFSYGTLQFKNVQLDTFGRILNGTKEKLLGYKTDRLRITDHSVINSSNTDSHPIIRYTGNEIDLVEGMVFEVTHDELLLADSYEVDDYTRIKVKFKSGRGGWVYVGI